jgi:hypothetical protein
MAPRPGHMPPTRPVWPLLRRSPNETREAYEARMDAFYPDPIGEREAEDIAGEAKAPTQPPPPRVVRLVDISRAARPVTPPEIACAWRAEGQLVRVPTGFPAVDEACRGGLPIPWRLVIVGAPSAGKSAIAMVLAHRFATIGGLVVGVMGVDEEPEDVTVRLAQMAGFTIAQCEGRDPMVLEQMAASLAGIRVRFYDARHTIEAAADDVAAWAAQEGRRPALVLDSLQTVRAIGSVGASGPRELVDLNLGAIRAKGTEHRMLMVATSEANRGSYRNDDAAETSSDMAAGKESGGIEFGAQTLMVLRTPKGHPDHVHVRVPKNRRGARAGFEFFLRLDREHHELGECTDPTTDPDAATQAAAQKRQHNRSVVDADAMVLAGIVRTRPGIGERELRGAIRATGHRWGVERLNGARELLRTGRRGERLVDRGTGKGCQWHLVQTGTGER